VDRSDSALSRRLGGAAERRRRHRRFAAVAALLLAVAAVLVFVVGEDDDSEAGFAAAATATCESFAERIRSEFALSFPDGAAPNAEAEAEYLSRAFADTMDDLVAELRTLEGSDGDDPAGAIDALAARIAEIRADPLPVAEAATNPFAEDVSPRFDELGVPACGSEFFGPSQ
jgi:hypothetical protein